MKKFFSLLLAMVMVFSVVTAMAYEWEIDYAPILSNPVLTELKKNIKRGDGDMIYPPEKHPYLFVNEEYIAQLKAKKDDVDFKGNYDYVLALANDVLPVLPADRKLNTKISRQLEARALMYLLGEVPKSHAKETVEYALKYLEAPETAQTYSISIYKDFGTQGIQTGALIYDWCYDAMNMGERQLLAEYVRNLMYDSRQPCRPNNLGEWTEVGGKAVGEPLIYNSIGATAIYDAYPEIYESIMPLIQGTMAEVVKLYGQAGALSDGSISYTREYYSYYVAMLFDRMGYPDFYGDISRVGYRILYSRLPYGALLREGDDPKQRDYQIGRYTLGAETLEDLSILSTMYNDPYFKFQYVKEGEENYEGVFDLLLKSNDVEPKLPDDLPLSIYVDYPRSEILARTSWQDGLDSPAVSAYMNMNNRRSGDHDHDDIGNFQLYYKGPLTLQAGQYKSDLYGLDHWGSYYSRTVAANCLTVYMPGEIFANNPSRANDGGQLKPAGPYYKFKDHMAESNYVTTTESHYIGPNEKTPAFSYIKGDLTKAYSPDKMASYKRAMVFMDTFNEQYPGVMIVLDDVTSKKASYEKKWLLQAAADPVVEGNKITIRNTAEGCHGMLVNKTLLPSEVDIESIGGAGIYYSDGKERPMDVPSTASDSYLGGWRCEVSPKTEAEDDIFLNAMYVTDADTKEELPMNYVENDNFIGVSTLDRLVMFSKTGETVNKAFEIEVNSGEYDEVYCLITDISEGKWKIEGGGETIILNTTEDENCLMFTSKSGKYTFTPADDKAEPHIIEYPEEEKEKIGDFSIKVGTVYAYVKSPNKIIDGVPYFAIADFAENQLKSSVSKEGDTLVIKSKIGPIVKIKSGEKKYEYTMAGVSRESEMKYAPFADEKGVLYINPEGICEDLGFTASYSNIAKVMKCKLSASLLSSQSKELEGVEDDRVIWPMFITASTDDGNVPENTIDRNLATRWSALPADGEWLCFDLGVEYELGAVQIAFYNGDKRNWKFDIQVSNDGVNFTTVLKGKKSGGKTLGVETFDLPEGTKGRYVRYFGHGEEVTASLYNSLTEFIVLK